MRSCGEFGTRWMSLPGRRFESDCRTKRLSQRSRRGDYFGRWIAPLSNSVSEQNIVDLIPETQLRYTQALINWNTARQNAKRYRRLMNKAIDDDNQGAVLWWQMKYEDSDHRARICKREADYWLNMIHDLQEAERT